jgi:hypothetical protein
MIQDRLLPALEVLLGRGSHDVVDTAVRAAGGRLLGLHRRQVLYRPGEEASVRYAATVSWAGGAPLAETIVAVTHVEGPPAGTLVVAAGDLTVGVFRYPHDPALPGLPIATSALAVAGQLGIAGPTVRLSVRTYRPGRRAVIHARETVGGGALADSRERFLKVVPPAEAATLRAGLEHLRRHVPVPRVDGSWPELGIVALDSLPGRTIREILVAGDRGALAALPDADAILDLLERFPQPAADAPRQRGPISRAAAHAGLLARLLPDERARLATIVERIGDPPTGLAAVAVHGDLHVAQLLVEGPRLAGVLDFDDAGRGHRVDDLATMLGHLATLAAAVPRRRARIEGYLARLWPSFAASTSEDELRRGVAAAIIGLASGPFRIQQRDWRRRVRDRLALAEAWLAGPGGLAQT